MRKINIGITIIVKNPAESSLFSNGIRQNVLLLRDIYEKCSNVDKAYIVNVATVDSESYKKTSWEEYGRHMISFEEAKSMCDIVVICHGSLGIKKCKELSDLNKKIVVQILGSELSSFNEQILFNSDRVCSDMFARNDFISAVWTSPHFFYRDKFFFETIYNCPILEAPYIWDDRFIKKHVDMAKQKDPSNEVIYKPKNGPKRLGTMEPNINIVKTSVIPIVIAEKLQKTYPECFSKMFVFGANKIKLKKEMVDFVKDLEVYKNKKMSFESRYPIVWTLNKHTDIVLCHQSGCELNYLYLDAAWLGYPVVHNSPMMKELGWYYPDNNAIVAVEHINYIAKNFDIIEHSTYLERSRKFAFRYMIDNPENVKGYEDLIEGVIKA